MDLARGGAQLLAHHDPARELVTQLDCARDGVVVRDADDVETGVLDGVAQLVRRRGGIPAPHRVTVQVGADPARGDGCGEMGVALDSRR